DGGGNDTYNFDRYTWNLKVDLQPGHWSSGGQTAELAYGQDAPGTVANALLYQGDERSLIENAIGGTGDDVITGNFAANRLAGGGGIDLLQGLAGDDMLIAGAGNRRWELAPGPELDRSSRDLALSLDGVMKINPTSWVERSLAVPYARVEGASTGAVEYYRFTVREPGRISIDIDQAEGSLAIELSDGSGRRLASNSDGSVTDPGDIGATQPYIAYDAGPGHYFIKVSYAADAEPFTWVMNVSVPGAAVEQITGSRLEGGAGNDGLYGEAADDMLLGGSEADTLDGGGGLDTLNGGDGADILMGRMDGDVLIGGAGADTASYKLAASGVAVDLTLTSAESVAAGADWMQGVENLTGSGFDDQLTGDRGANVLDGGAGADVLAGGSRNDVYVVDQAGDRVIELAGDDKDQVLSSISYALGTHVEQLTLTGSAAIGGRGNDAANAIVGNAAANLLQAYGGEDVLDGRGGADTMKGGQGNDLYHVDQAGDRVVEAAGEGEDTIFSNVSFRLGDHVEILGLTGEGDIGGTGNALANRLSGNDGDNRLDGGAGADLLAGGAGNDVYVVERGTDRVSESAASIGIDRVESSVSFTLTDGVENLTLTGNAAIGGTGNAAANLLTGNNAANRLDGGGGADRMIGGGGNDVYSVDAAGDAVIEASATGGRDMVRSAISYTIGLKLDNLTLIGSEAIDGTGNRFDNLLTGNAGANALDGEAGADKLNGGAGHDGLAGGRGSDVLTGGTGRDSFVFDSFLGGGEVDTIADFSAADDSFRLDGSVFAAFAAEGRIAGGAFQTGRAALDGSDRILYDGASGKIFYDADGSGDIAAILFAKVDAGSALTAADFIVYG
ncbi:MAG TPA: pre-peptidase C-terminal domain-containing protein, partial [Allosphingosinicella sp.]